MRTVAELKERWIAEISAIVLPTCMYVSTAREAEVLCGQLVEDVCFLEEVDSDFVDADRQGHGSTGVSGAFERVFGAGTRSAAGVVSVYARHFHRLGYLAIDRAVDWGPLAEKARAGLGDLRRSELEELYGEPSLVVDGRVGCYVSAEGWLYVDYQGPELLGPQELVRDVRVPAGSGFQLGGRSGGERSALGSFDDGVCWTPYGRTLVGGGL
ncbi:hypothetical protein [Kribbella sp. NPDC051770]|uniref:hypothetical protein n=1 Tax=Kribbella sp. NPDC051770 TaxID=3155413 RepID=UPI00341B78C1